ncbi:hypothetical protein AKJ16_DCAP14157 [Drosera capensis]
MERLEQHSLITSLSAPSESTPSSPPPLTESTPPAPPPSTESTPPDFYFDYVVNDSKLFCAISLITAVATPTTPTDSGSQQTPSVTAAVVAVACVMAIAVVILCLLRKKSVRGEPKGGNHVLTGSDIESARLQHRNLVRLMGFCLDGEEK